LAITFYTSITAFLEMPLSEVFAYNAIAEKIIAKSENSRKGK
jgi:hypothetical protein